jgi:accessory gene regulator B
MKAAEKFLSHLSAELNLDSSQAEIIRYGLLSLVFSFAGALAVVAFSAPFGLLREALVVMMTGLIFRKLSGGAHCKTPLACLTVGTTVILMLAWLAATTGSSWSASPPWIFVPPAVALVIAWFYAPADVPQKPITSPAQRKTLRLLTFSYLTCWTVLGTMLFFTEKPALLYFFFSGNLGLLWQSFLLTPPGYQLIDRANILFLKNS